LEEEKNRINFSVGNCETGAYVGGTVHPREREREREKINKIKINIRSNFFFCSATTRLLTQVPFLRVPNVGQNFRSQVVACIVMERLHGKSSIILHLRINMESGQRR
jgi:hypothetical protein